MKILPIIILTTFFALVVSVIIYLAKRFAMSFEAVNTLPFYIGFSVVIILFFVAGIVFINSTGAIEHIIFKIAAIVIGVFLFTIFSVIIVDVIGLFIKFSPRTYAISYISLTALITLFGLWNSFNIQNTRLEIPMDGLTENIKAVHLTDIHIGHFRTNGFLDKMIEKTNAENPDVIFITGDYLDSRYALDNKYFEPLQKLNAPVYFVDGNHDKATNNESINSLMRKNGINVLENKVMHFKGLQIVGLMHMIADNHSFDIHASGQNQTIESVLPQLNIDRNKASVILHHAPNGIKYAQQNGIGLYLAGHTHAGQLFPFNFIASMMFEYNRGLHDYKGTKVFVSEGIGTFGPPFRLGTKSEIVTLNLTPKR